VSDFFQSSAWRQLRYQCLRRDGWRCSCCARSVRKRGESRVSHIEPRTQRPDLALVLSNLRTLCGGCDDDRRKREKGNPRAVRVPVASDALSAAWR
jgi:5-methylcytosine-specific restriction protein A